MDKKASILFIKQILDQKTNEDTCLTLTQIRDILKNEYKIDLEVKAIGRNIKCLKDDCGYSIVKTGKGFFTEDREYDDTELKFLVDSVLSNRFIPRKNTEQLIKKIYNLTSPKLRDMTKYLESYNKYSKTGNSEVFLNIELIEEAIAKNVQISFQYCNYNINKQLVARHDGKIYYATPYRLIVKQQRYYLMSKDQEKGKLVYFKLDKIINVQIHEELPGDDINTLKSFKNGINDQVLHDYLPYAFGDKPEEIVLELIKTDDGIDVLCEWFGDNVRFNQCSNGRIRATLKASPQAMSYFCLQFIEKFKVIRPVSVVNTMKERLENGLKEYNTN